MELTAAAGGPPPESPEVAEGRIDWTPKDVLFGLLAFVGSFLLLPIPFIIPVALIWDDREGRPFLVAVSIVSAGIYLAIVYAAAHFSFLKYGGGVERLGLRPPTMPTLGWGVLAFMGALGVSLAYNNIIQIPGLDFLEQGCADQVPKFIRYDEVVLALSAVLAICFAPICEEIFFRGFVFPGIARAFGIGAGIAVSGLLFGSAHLLGNPMLYKSMIQFTLIGCVFAFFYWKSGNLLSTIMAHTTFNILGVILIAATTCKE
jgi:membrane protease YdiL (CAAX protease family)